MSRNPKSLAILSQVDSQAFRAWFRQSKVVDAKGDPLVVYHGTNTEIRAFDQKESRNGFWFSDDISDASDYGNGTVEAYISLKNPAYFERTSGDKGLIDAIAKAKVDGNDGLIVTSPEDGDGNGMHWPTNYVAFRPEQIKSATGNCGTFCPTNPDIRFSFVGSRSAHADSRALAAARERLASGEDAENVRKETGWFRGNDTEFRYEIDDSSATYALKNGKPFDMDSLSVRSGDEFLLSDVLHHPALFSAYPRLANVRVKIANRTGARGSFDGGTNTIELSNEYSPQSVFSTLLHEIQHVLQDIEGFARGGAPLGATPMQVRPYHGVAAYLAALERLAGVDVSGYEPSSLGDVDPVSFVQSWDAPRQSLNCRLTPEQAEWINGLGDYLFVEGTEFATVFEVLAGDAVRDIECGVTGPNPVLAYHRLAGEVEARNTQARQHMTAADRVAKSPNETADVEGEDVIVISSRFSKDRAR